MITFHQPPVAISVEGGIVARMAQFMIESAGEAVDETALVRAGFTRAEIAQHSAEAVDLANLTGRA